jgi:DHA1 family inner membrane transport protein
VLGFGGMFGAFTYIAFTLTEVSGFASAAVPWLLILFGIGTFLGNIVGGKAADRSRDLTIAVFLAGLTVVLTAFALLASNPVATVVLLALMGGFGFGTVPGLQTRIMHFADHAPTLASSSNIAAFNVGNALGAWLGGITITAGLGYTSPLWVGAVLTLTALLVMIVALRLSTATDRMSRAASPRTTAVS